MENNMNDNVNTIVRFTELNMSQLIYYDQETTQAC